MKKRKLYDFSPFAAVITSVAYAFVFFLFGYLVINTASKVLYGIILGVAVLSAVFLVLFFVVFTTCLEADGIRQGKRFIKKEDIIYNVLYDETYKQKIIVVTDASVNYSLLDLDEKKLKTVIFQATPQNVLKFGEYVGADITVPVKPPRRRS